MTARERRESESFKKYGQNLKKEAKKVRPIRYIIRHEIVRDLITGKFGIKGNTYNVGNNKQKRERRAINI